MTVQYLHTPAMFSSVIPDDQDDLVVLPELLQFICLIFPTSLSGEKQNGRNSFMQQLKSEDNSKKFNIFRNVFPFERENFTVIIFNLNIHEEMFFP